MRLGKTFLTIKWIKTRPERNSVLIVCPKEVIRVWVKEFAKENIKAIPLVGTSEQKLRTLLDAKDKGDNYFITNTAGLVKNGKNLEHVKIPGRESNIALFEWDIVVIDESTSIRTATATITKVCIKHLNAKYKAILSGLPNPEGPEDFVCQLIWLFGSVMNCDNYYKFRAAHMSCLGYGGWVVRKKSKEKLKKVVQEKCIILSRKSAGVGSKKVRSIRYVTIPNKIKKAMLSARKDFELGDKLSNNVLVPLIWISQLAGGLYADEELQHDEKLKEVVRLLKVELKNQPIVIWARYTAEILAIKDYIKKKLKLKVEIIKSGLDNDTTVEKFMDGKLDIIVCQPKSLKMGVDLSISSTAICYSNYYDAEIRAQIEDRIVHPEKSEPVLIIDIVAEDTLDEVMPEILGKKRYTSQSFLEVITKEVIRRAA